MWAGIAGAVINNGTTFEVAISIHDSVYNTDFASTTIPYSTNNPETQASEIEKHVLDVLRKFSTEHMCKFLGAGVTVSLLREVRLQTLCLQFAPGSASGLPLQPRRVFYARRVCPCAAHWFCGAKTGKDQARLLPRSFLEELLCVPDSFTGFYEAPPRSACAINGKTRLVLLSSPTSELASLAESQRSAQACRPGDGRSDSQFCCPCALCTI